MPVFSMVFSSFQFLFFLLPVTLAAFHLFRVRDCTRHAKTALILGSLVFYAWAGIQFLPLVIFSVGANYGIGALMHRHVTRLLFPAGIAFNLGLLAYFKYAGFIAAMFGLDAVAQTVIMPLAISFFTFQQIAYLAGIKDGESPAEGLLDYMLFILFFPHLIAGPITRHTEMLPQFARAGVGRMDPRCVTMGISILILGLAKKTLLADPLATLADPVFDVIAHGMPLTASASWAGALAYTFQLYFDFSGYSDMAVGLGLLFGIRFPINFASPYQAGSIIEFWRRWHITLSRFLRNHLYIPLGGNRHGSARRHLNLMITMALGGLWHGAGWGFVIWGALHGLYLITNHGWRSVFGEARAPAARAASWALTFLAVAVGWVFFRAASLSAATAMLAAMAGIGDAATPSSLPAPPIAVALLGTAATVAFLLPNTLVLTGYATAAPRRVRPVLTAAALGAIAALCLTRLPNPGVFLYFNF